MKDINDLRRDRVAASDNLTSKAQALAALETADGERDADAIEAAQTEFDAAEAAFKSADSAVKAVETAMAAKAASATSEAEGLGAQPGGGVAASAKDPNDQGIEFGAMVHALANCKGDRERACERLDRDGHSGISAALSGATDAAGGVTIPQAQAQDVIELLRPRVTVMASGARQIDMPAGQLRNARQATSATANYGAENAPAVESEPTFDSVSQSFKTLRALVPVGNALLRHSSAMIFGMVRDDIIDTMGLRKDLAFLRSDGSSGTPKGIGSWALPGQTRTAVAATPAAVEAAIRGMVSDVEDANVMLTTPGWIMRASTKNFLASLRDPASGVYLFPSIEQSGTLKGYPIRTTSQLPTNLGVGGDEAEVFFADFNEIMVGNSYALTLASSGEAAYVDTSGDTISAFQNDLTLMRAIEEHDLAPRHDVAISKLTGAGWTL